MAGTADAIAARFPEATRCELPGLREMEYGELEGASISGVRPQMADIAAAWCVQHLSHRARSLHLRGIQSGPLFTQLQKYASLQ